VSGSTDCTDALQHWNIGALEHWSIAALQQMKNTWNEVSNDILSYS
jgi:hypothetical protein